MLKILEDVACTMCGCVCDDLTLQIDGSRVTGVENACTRSEPWFLSQTNGSGVPLARVRGEDVDFGVAIHQAARLLDESRAPLIFGLSSSSVPGIRAACRLADKLGATIDPASSALGRATMVAMQSAGMSTATLGEVRNRADLIVYWGCDPLVTHPRHIQRFVEAPGLYVRNGRRDRQVVVINNRPTATADLADRFIQPNTDDQFELLLALRAVVQAKKIRQKSICGVPISEVADLADQLKSSNYAVLVYGDGIASRDVPHANVEALLRLVNELHSHTRAAALPLTSEVSGASEVLTWQTGYPLGVSFARGYPQYGPSEFSANALLEGKESDLVVLVGSQSAGGLSDQAKANLRHLPTVVLNTVGTESIDSADIQFTVGTYGIHRAGTAYRMDNVPIPLRPVFDSPLPSDAEVLNRIYDAVGPSTGHALSTD